MSERRKFFAGRLGRIDGESPRRQAVEQILRHRPKVAGSLKDQELVPHLVRIDAAAQAKSRQRQRHLAQWSGRGPASGTSPAWPPGPWPLPSSTVETVTAVCSVVARPQQLETKRQFLRAPDTRIRIEANAAVLLRAQFVERRGQRGFAAEYRAAPARFFAVVQQGLVAEGVARGGVVGALGAAGAMGAMGVAVRDCATELPAAAAALPAAQAHSTSAISRIGLRILTCKTSP